MTDRPNLSKGTPAGTPAASRPAPPKFVLYTAIALLVSGVMAVLAAASVYTGSVETFFRDSTRDTVSDQMSDKFDEIKKAGPSGGDRAAELTALQNQIKALKSNEGAALTTQANEIKTKIDGLTPGASKNGKTLLGDLDKQADTVRDLDSTVGKTQKGLLVSSLIILVALGVAAGAAYRGRYWSRWAVIGLWVLSTLTGTLASINYLLAVTSDIPALFKVPAFLSSLALVVAVVLVNLRPSINYYALSKPARGARPQRRGLFTPPPRQPQSAPPAADTSSDDVPAGSGGPDRARTKQRSSDAAVAKGAELARSRAKASKSRRTGA